METTEIGIGLPHELMKTIDLNTRNGIVRAARHGLAALGLSLSLGLPALSQNFIPLGVPGSPAPWNKLPPPFGTIEFAWAPLPAAPNGVPILAIASSSRMGPCS